MGMENRTGAMQFHFRPFSTDPTVQAVLFMAFLWLYLGSLTGNLTIALTVWRERSLHTPMYFFLFVLAVLEIGYSTDIAPLTLASVASAGRTSVSLSSCGAQMFFFIFFGGSDCVLLAVMAYDRYVAICQPLHYTLRMSWQACTQMALGSLALGFLLSLPLTALICRLPFCDGTEIYHFFCDMSAVLRLACADTRVHEAALYVISVAAVAVPFLLICISYAFIMATVLRMKSAEGQRRAVSTCSSHLLVVLLQYGSCTLVYLRPSSSYSPEEGRVVSLVYSFFSPLLNPLIYSMRNKEVKDAVGRLLRRPRLAQKAKTLFPEK